MKTENLFQIISKAETIHEVEAALAEFEASNENLAWIPVGNKENNRGPIEVATDPGRSLIERVTNAVDAVLEAEYEKHDGLPRCRSPKEATTAWLNVPEEGLSGLTVTQRRNLSQRVLVTVSDGEGAKESRTVEVADRGVGIRPAQMPGTILSLNESNKMQKHHLAGVYGQGGSSTFAMSKYTVIASRYGAELTVGFSIVRYNDLPPEEYKVGNYVYLTQNGGVLEASIPQEDFPTGTVARHFGYDLTKYPSPLGPSSLYGLFNEVLFDPIIPIFLDNKALTTRQRRTIVGSRNRLNGAVEDDDESRRGVSIVHNVPLYFSSLGEFGRIGIEYWVLERPTKENRRPSATYVNPAKPIILTHNGQNHAEIGSLLIRKDCELPFLSQRLICHINCDSLSPYAKRLLFASTREEARSGIVYDLIRNEIIRALRSDDQLTRLNNEARELGREEQDKTAEQQMRSEVARILRIQGLNIAEEAGASVGANKGDARPVQPAPQPRRPQPIDLHEPPTYIKIVWDEEDAISFYPEQRRYLRIETDANSSYHDPLSPTRSRINVIVTGNGVNLRGTTPLKEGRLRSIFECSPDGKTGDTGVIRVELSRPGLPVLSDERDFRIVDRPPIREPQKRVNLPPFKVIPVEGPDSQRWADLGWSDNPNTIASSAQMEEGVLEVYYSTVFPNFKNRVSQLEARDTTLAKSFTRRYEIWLAVHSLLVYQDQQTNQSESPDGETSERDGNSEVLEGIEQKERCRMATLSAIFAQREIQIAPAEEISAEG